MSQPAVIANLALAPQAPTGTAPNSLAPGLRLHEPRGESDQARKRVLILEDDPSFGEIMTELLRESCFEVVTVANGVEGVHQVLAGDFEVILCDMMMPTLPGDMFFRAVERMRPHLCDRFVFMTGHRNNQKVNEFIESVDGTILMKPFPLDALLEVVAFIEVRKLLLAA